MLSSADLPTGANTLHGKRERTRAISAPRALGGVRCLSVQTT